MTPAPSSGNPASGPAAPAAPASHRIRGTRWIQATAKRRRLRPVQLLVGSFALLIAFGTLGLMVLPGLYAGPRLGWLQALFTATSAVCVTGLIVVNTATAFTPFGKAFLLLLIQLGGLGIITFATLIIVGLGGRLSLRQEAISAAATEAAPHIDFRRLTRSVVTFSLILEAAGAIVLWLAWLPGFGAVTAAGHAIFHAISAFCNAGFSSFSDSLVGFRENPAVLVTIMLLIMSGGLGFLSLEELWSLRRRPRGRRSGRLSLHSRLVLATTAALLLTGWALLATLEWRGTLAGIPPWARALNGLFMSVTARTAGFNTVDYAQVSDSSAFLTIILMFIGGAPGSTAGGVKVTTLALVFLLAWSRVRGRRTSDAWSRTVPDDTLQRAVGLFVFGFMILSVAILAYTAVSPSPLSPATPLHTRFLPNVFEATSAFGTVGLSMGATPTLTAAGQLITIVLMFLGRVGLLAFAAAIAVPETLRLGRFRFAHEDVIVG
ncbi:MAG: potassium transporter TrkH [Gemmatimonadetes bacterium]|nr:potassium transporter TrkH [Gemmatimonadota bacterium]